MNQATERWWELAQAARLHQLTSYDAVYFDLAVRLGIPLITDDGNLQSAIERVGIEWIEPALGHTYVVTVTIRKFHFMRSAEMILP